MSVIACSDVTNRGRLVIGGQRDHLLEQSEVGVWVGQSIAHGVDAEVGRAEFAPEADVGRPSVLGDIGNGEPGFEADGVAGAPGFFGIVTDAT